MLIGITGKIGSGKTTIANHIIQKYNFIEYSFAEPLKQIGLIFGFEYQQLYGTQQQKLEINRYWGVSGREFLQKVGTDLFRKQLKQILPSMNVDSVWVDIFKLKYDKNKCYIIPDVRFLDEAQAIKDLGGIIIKTTRNNLINSQDGKEHVHISELEIEKIVPDFIIDNNKPIEETKNTINNIVESINSL